jgi:medium-chain acyl-[acyl-carrier-protein] hydrolase
MSPLAEAVAEALTPLLDKPFAFFGHSLGTLVAFEVARRLRELYSVAPVRMIVSAGAAPQVPRRKTPVHNLPEKEFLAELRRLNGTPLEILNHAELMEIMVPLLRADFAVYETYQYTAAPTLNCPIAAFGGLRDERVRPADLAAWSAQTSGSFSLRMFPGDHFFLKQPLVLRAISRELE